jgi:hypothetical protein
MLGFEVAFGSVPGRDHKAVSKNNQDAWAITSGHNYLIAVVCDGCSQGKHSEVGAQVGAQLTVSTLAKNFEKITDPMVLADTEAISGFLERARLDILAQLRILALAMGGSFSQTISDYFLFTVIGTMITPRVTFVFSIGDGVLTLNEEVVRLGPFPDNKPPYLAYGLIETPFDQVNPNPLKFQLNIFDLTKNVKSILIGTDGIEYLIKAENMKMPGKDGLVGPLSQFWTEDGYYTNSDKVRRRLALVNRDVNKFRKDGSLEKENGLLFDDTTLVVIRQNPKRDEVDDECDDK